MRTQILLRQAEVIRIKNVPKETLISKIKASRNNEVESKFTHLNDENSLAEDDLAIIHLRRELDYFESLLIFFKIEDVFDSVQCETGSKSKKSRAKQYIDQVRSEICNFMEPGKKGNDVIAFVNEKMVQLKLEDESQLNLIQQKILTSLQSAINDKFSETNYKSQQKSKNEVKGNSCIPFKPFHFLRKRFFGKNKSINKRKAE